MSRPVIDRSSASLRADIASRAARIIAEGHVHDFAQAKRKAARQLGITDGRSLPSNQAISDALTEYRAVYQPDYPGLLADYRRKAIYLMRFFANYRPYLTGSVLNGSAGPHSNINLLLYHDDPKTLEIFLIDRKIDYQYKESAGVPHVPGYPTLSFWYDDTPVLLHVRPLAAERNGSHREERASLVEMEKMLDDAGPDMAAGHGGKD